MSDHEKPPVHIVEIPQGRPYVLITFAGPGSALAEIKKENNVLPAMILGVAGFMLIETCFAFVMALKAGQRILVPQGRA